MDALSVPGVHLDASSLLRFRALASSRRASPIPTRAQPPGALSARRQGRGIDIDDVRLWNWGDDARHIDHNVTARTGEAHVRRFRDESERATLLVMDLRPSMLFGTRRAFRSVAGAEALTLAGWRAAISGCRVGLHILRPEDPVHLRPRSGERSMPAIIGALARAHEEELRRPGSRDPPLDAEILRMMRLIPRGGLMIMASALESPGRAFEDAVRAASARAELRILVPRDAFEMRPPPGLYPFATEDGRHGLAAVRIKTRGPVRDAKLHRLRSLGVSVVEIEGGMEPPEMLRALELGDAGL